MSKKTSPEKREAIKARKKAIKDRADYLLANRAILCTVHGCDRPRLKDNLCDYHQPEAITKRDALAAKEAAALLPLLAVVAPTLLGRRR